jgi:hypothetical protein
MRQALPVDGKQCLLMLRTRQFPALDPAILLIPQRPLLTITSNVESPGSKFGRCRSDGCDGVAATIVKGAMDRRLCAGGRRVLSVVPMDGPEITFHEGALPQFDE